LRGRRIGKISLGSYPFRRSPATAPAGFARFAFADLSTGCVSQLERGAKRPTGPALALLDVIRRKGIVAILRNAQSYVSRSAGCCFS